MNRIEVERLIKVIDANPRITNVAYHLDVAREYASGANVKYQHAINTPVSQSLIPWNDPDSDGPMFLESVKYKALPRNLTLEEAEEMLNELLDYKIEITGE